MERIVREAFSDVIIASLHPRTSISITVQITQDEGSVSINYYIIIKINNKYNRRILIIIFF